MDRLELELRALALHNPAPPEVQSYELAQVAQKALEWDRVVRGTHLTNCWYNYACNFNIFVKDGVVVREEQVGGYPPQNDPSVPDFNPRGCQKGACYSHRMYDPARLKYPLKRAGARGEGKWQSVSWDQALTEMADTLIDVLVNDGPEAIIHLGGTMHGTGSDAVATNAFNTLLGIGSLMATNDNGDEHPGAALTFGKIVFSCSLDNWFYADLLLVWGGNPAYTHIPNFHFLTEARYNGTRVVAITPDYSASAPFADLWLPVNIGSDAALALAMARTIVREKLYKADFLREQTDLPLLVREDTRKFLKEKDLKRGGREDVFFIYDTRSKKVVEAPYKSLALGGLVPALEGEYEVRTVEGKRVKVRPAFESLKERLEEYPLEKASQITGVSARQIEELAMEIARAKGVVNITTAQWGKHYHGDLIQRAIILVFALCGHIGRKGGCYNAYPMILPDTALGQWQRRGSQALTAAAAADPRFAQWKEQGYTDEMILYEYWNDAEAQGLVGNSLLFYLFHGGMMDIAKMNNGWDPYLKRPMEEYLKEALDKGWQWVVPFGGKEPRVLMEGGGSLLRRARASHRLIQNLLPKIKMIVTIDWRMGSTGFYSDYLLPAACWYEKFSMVWSVPEMPFMHLVNKAVEPLGEAKTEWEIYCLLAKKMAERAGERGISSFKGRGDKEVRFADLYDQITANGLYSEDDPEAVTRDWFVNAVNLEKMDWEEYKERGVCRLTAIGNATPGNATDVIPGEPVIPLTHHTEKKQPYPTLTRRMQFYIDHDWYLELGEEFPTHKDIPKMGGDYPLQLTGGHARWSIHSCWTDHALMLRLQRGQPLMFVNNKDAQARGIKDGDEVEVRNDIASFRIMAAVSPAVRPGQVIIYHNWENFQFPGKDHFKSVMASPLNPIELAGGYGHLRPRGQYHGQPGASDRGTRVEVEKAPLGQA